MGYKITVEDEDTGEKVTTVTGSMYILAVGSKDKKDPDGTIDACCGSSGYFRDLSRLYITLGKSVYDCCAPVKKTSPKED